MSTFKGRINTGLPLHTANTTRDYTPVSIKEENNENYLTIKTATLQPPNEKMMFAPNFQRSLNMQTQKMVQLDNQNQNADADFEDYSKKKNASSNMDIRKQVKMENETRRIQGGKQNLAETFKVFTGTVDRVIRWRKIYKEFYYVEVIAPVISIQEGSVCFQKIILLRDKRGPILQVQHYANDHIDIQDFYIGQVLRCVGHMVGPNVLHAVSIRAATEEELTHHQRLCYICDHAIARCASNS